MKYDNLWPNFDEFYQNNCITSISIILTKLLCFMNVAVSKIEVVALIKIYTYEKVKYDKLSVCDFTSPLLTGFAVINDR